MDNGAYHGMTERRNTDDAPLNTTEQTGEFKEPKGAFVTHAVMDETPFNATEHAIRDALNSAHTALDHYRRTRKDPTEEALQKAVDALTLALSLDLTRGAKCS